MNQTDRGLFHLLRDLRSRAHSLQQYRSWAIASIFIVAAGPCQLQGGGGSSGAVQSAPGQTAQAITFTSTPPTSPAVSNTYTASATGGGSDNPVTFSIDASSTPKACSVSEATVGFSGTGTCVVDANQAGNSNYTAAPQVQQTITVTDSVGSTSGSGPTAGLSLAFNGTSLDTSTWQTCYWWVSAGSGCTNFGNPQEEEWYLASQDIFSGGAFHLVETQTPTQGWTKSGAPETYPYRSGIVTTYSSFNFTYGYVQVTARIPGGTGTWPTLWLLPANKAWPPEIDIMENWGSSNQIQCTVHWGTSSNPQQADQQVTSSSDLTSGWHTYGLLWQRGSLTWYLDGKVVDTYTGSAVPNQPMYFLANLAIDGPATSGSSFDIQSVQIYH